MCGITGIAGFNDVNLLRRMTKSLEHRGPDDYGYYIDDNIALGNRRLSIIDLKTGKQPIHNEDQSVWITFNGEIFNYKELRAQLEEKGHRFYTNSDTEVIVHAYEEFPDFLSKLKGQFAIAIYDKNKKRLLLARDKLGIKPLYYCLIDNKLLFASEIKAILKYKELKRELNYDSLNDYLTFRYIPGKNTMLKNIYKLPPASCMIYENNIIQVSRYWDITYKIEQNSEDYFISKLNSQLESAIKSQMISDVPIGVYLSGGIDSGVTTAILSKLAGNNIKTFSIGFDISSEDIKNQLDETRYSRLIADRYNTDHKEIIINEDIIKILPKVIYHLDNPIAFETALPLYYLSNLANKKVKVILTGDGGDELFFGYHRYYDMNLRRKINRFIPFRISSQNNNSNSLLLKKINYVLSDDDSSYLKGFTTFNLEDRNNIYNDAVKPYIKDISSISSISKLIPLNMEYVHAIRYADMQHWLPDMVLSMSDNMSMANSIETRVPLLDENMVNFSFSIPSRILTQDAARDYTKPFFKKAAKDLLPKEVLDRKKHGFNVPLKAWQNDSLKQVSIQLMESEDAKSLFNKSYLDYLMNNAYSNNPGRALKMLKLYSITMFLLWKKIHIDNINPKKITI